MGDLLTTIRVGGVTRPIRPIPRNLRIGRLSFGLRQVCDRSGGLILGEGDTGKSTYVRMLTEEARCLGPTQLIPLRRRTLDLRCPDLKDGEVATIILDGLDEYPECVRDIVDFAEGVDPEKCRVWVTSRSGDAAAQLCESLRFEDIYHLETFTHDDVRKIAASSGIDAETFVGTVLGLHLETFLAKPGGAVLLMQLYANGRLDGLSRIELMESIMRGFAGETRDGHAFAATSDETDEKDILESTCWIAACLTLTGKAAVWTGPESECPQTDIPFGKLPEGTFSRNVFRVALQRRLFEPLTGQRFRLSYSEMPAFLSGRWLAKNVTRRQFEKLVPADDDSLTAAQAAVVAWTSCYEPSWGTRWIGIRPESFLACHELIRTFGVGRYFDALLERYRGGDYCRNPRDMFEGRMSDLSGFEEFAAEMISRLERKDQPEDAYDLAALLLSSCRCDADETAGVLVDCILHHRFDALVLSRMTGAVRAQCCVRTPACVGRLWPLYRSLSGATELCTRLTRANLAYCLDRGEWVALHAEAHADVRMEFESERVLTERQVQELLLTGEDDAPHPVAEDEADEQPADENDDVPFTVEELYGDIDELIVSDYYRELGSRWEGDGATEDDVDFDDALLGEDDRYSYLQRIFESQARRGLNYRSVGRFFRERLVEGSAQIFGIPRLLLYAIVFEPRRYLGMVVKLVRSEHQAVWDFFRWVERTDEFRKIATAVQEMEAEDVVDLLAFFWQTDAPGASVMTRVLKDRLWTDPSRKVVERLRGISQWMTEPRLEQRQLLMDMFGEDVAGDEAEDVFGSDSDEPVFKAEDLADDLESILDGEEDGVVTLEALAELTSVKPEPVKAVVVGVASAVKSEFTAEIGTAVKESVAAAVRNKGGRPRKEGRDPNALSQAQVAAAFGEPCTVNKVDQWERYLRSEGKRGTRPPSAEYKGRIVTYSPDLRNFPTPENKLILSALIAEYQSTHRVKSALKEKTVHCRSEETRFRARGGVQAELARKRENP